MYRLVLLLTALCLVFSSLNDIGVHGSTIDVLATPERKLRAAKRNDKLSRREVKGCLRHDHELHYLDTETATPNPQFGAKLSLDFKTPALMLEDIEHHISTIDCFSTRVYLYFHTRTAFAHAHLEFQNVENFLLITSHEGCNEDGERMPHLVSETALHIKDHLIILSTTRVPWKHTFDALTLDFGTSDKEDLVPRHHSDLRPRQAAATSAAAASSTSLVYPSAPSSTPVESNVTANFNPSLIDTAILPPDSSLSVHGPDLPAGFKVTCKNCTIQGSINLVSGSLTMGKFNSSSNGNEGFINATESAYEYVDHGYVRFQSNDFGAHIELESSISATSNLKTFTAPLPTIALTPFQVPGIASVGPQLVPQLSIGVELSAELDFSYGFEVYIPNDSYLILNVGNNSQSMQSGFENTNVTALPFQAQLPDISLTIAGGFIPQLLLGISFFNGDAIAGAGVFLNAPTITTTLSTVSHVNSKCENVTNNAIANEVINDIFDTLTHIDASVDLQLGVTAEAQVRLGKYILKEDEPYAVLDKSLSLPTACISFDGNAKTYGPAPTSTSTSTKAPGSKSSSGASIMPNPIGVQKDFCQVVAVAGLIFVGSWCSMFG